MTFCIPARFSTHQVSSENRYVYRHLPSNGHTPPLKLQFLTHLSYKWARPTSEWTANAVHFPCPPNGWRTCQNRRSTVLAPSFPCCEQDDKNSFEWRAQRTKVSLSNRLITPRLQNNNARAIMHFITCYDLVLFCIDNQRHGVVSLPAVRDDSIVNCSGASTIFGVHFVRLSWEMK